MMAEKPTLYVCHGDDAGPRRRPCRRVQEALRAAGIEYDKVIAAHGHPIPFFRKGSRDELREATGDTKLPARSSWRTERSSCTLAPSPPRSRARADRSGAGPLDAALLRARTAPVLTRRGSGEKLPLVRALALEHLRADPVGIFGDVLVERGIEVDAVRLEQGERLPDWRDYDLLVVMGGAMSVWEEDEYPWLVDEKRAIREAVLAGVPYFGVCLGSQLLASAFHARVYLGPEPELGANQMFLTAAARHDPVFRGFPPDVEVFEFHLCHFDLPRGAIRLARSPRYQNQAIRYGRVAYAIQCHLRWRRSARGSRARHTCSRGSSRGTARARWKRSSTSTRSSCLSSSGPDGSCSAAGSSTRSRSAAYAPPRTP
jgi:GMP synthase-like glutamine amidotransferase